MTTIMNTIANTLNNVANTGAPLIIPVIETTVHDFATLEAHDELYPVNIHAVHMAASPTLYVKGNMNLLTARHITSIVTSERTTDAGFGFCKKVTLDRATRAQDKPLILASTVKASVYMARLALEAGGSVILFLAEGYTDKAEGVTRSGKKYAAKPTASKCEQLFADFGYERLAVVTLINPDPLLEQKSSLFISSMRNMLVSELATEVFVGEIIGCDGGYDLVMDCIIARRNVYILDIDPTRKGMEETQNRRILETKNFNNDVCQLTSTRLAQL